MVRSQRNKIVNPITSPRRIENRSFKYTPAETRVIQIFGTGLVLPRKYLFCVTPKTQEDIKPNPVVVAIGVVKDSKTQFAWQRFVI